MSIFQTIQSLSIKDPGLPHVPYASSTRMRMLSYAYKLEHIRICPAFVIHCHTFALCGIVLHNKRNGKVKATARKHGIRII